MVSTVQSLPPSGNLTAERQDSWVWKWVETQAQSQWPRWGRCEPTNANLREPHLVFRCLCEPPTRVALRASTVPPSCTRAKKALGRVPPGLLFLEASNVRKASSLGRSETDLL